MLFYVTKSLCILTLSVSSKGIDESSVDDEVFFSFAPDKQRRRKEKPGFLPGIKEEEKPVPAVPPVAKDQVEGPPAP